MRARPVIAVLSSVFLIAGASIALDLPFKIGLASFSMSNWADWGYTFFSLGADIAVVYLMIDLLLLRDERKRWETVQDRVMNLLNAELIGIFDDLAFATVGPLLAISTQENPAQEQMEASRREWHRKMRLLAEDSETLKRQVDPDLNRWHVFKFIDHYGGQFSWRAKNLADFQLRYSSRFLEPGLFAFIIDAEQLLKSLGSTVSNLVNYQSTQANRFLKQTGDESETWARIAEIWREQIYSDLQRLLKVFVQAIDEGMIRLS
jgi:hypothetical protein